MCGRYYLDETSSAYQKLFQKILNNDLLRSIKQHQLNEVFPGNNCLVLINENNKIVADVRKWGFKLNKKQIINARSESIEYTRAFQNMNKPCIVVANGYYEWDKQKERHYFSNEKGLLYMAGKCDDNSFVVLTKDTDKHSSIHSRQPVLCSVQDVKKYLKIK